MFEQDVVGRASSLAASARRGREGKGANLNVSLSSLVSGGQAEPNLDERTKGVKWWVRFRFEPRGVEGSVVLSLA